MALQRAKVRILKVIQNENILQIEKAWFSPSGLKLEVMISWSFRHTFCHLFTFHRMCGKHISSILA